MNKKICKLIFMIVLFFSTLNNVFAYSLIRVGDTGKTINLSDVYGSSLVSSYLSYRFTFVDKDGKILTNTVPADITFYVPSDKTKPYNFGGIYYKTFKFSDTVFSDLSYGSNNDLLDSCTDDKTCMSYVEEQLKSTNSTLMTKILQKTKQGSIPITIPESGMYVAVEKLYTVDLNTETIGHSVSWSDLCGYYKKREENKTEINNDYESIRNVYYNDIGKITMERQCDNITISGLSQTAFVPISLNNNYYTGTGLEIAKLLNEKKYEPKIDGKNIFKIGNLVFSNATNLPNGSVQLFGEDLKISSQSDLDKIPNFTAIKSLATGCYGSNLSCILDKTKGYGVNIFNIYDGITYGCNSEQDADDLNRSWTGSACCPVGQIYNSKTEKCSGALPYNPPGGTTNTYVYGCSPTADICKSNLDSTINNLGDGTLTVNSENETKLDSDNIGECVLYNDKYKVDYNGTIIYCSETLNTDFSDPISGFSANFSGSYTNGKFIPINNMPSLNKKVTCYAPSTVNTDVLKNYSKSFNNKTSNMEVSVNFLGSQTHKFSNNVITVKNISKISNAETTYGKTYNKIYFELEYDYSYSSASLNKYISIETALGSTTKIGTAQKTMLNDVNFKIPTGTASGTYTSSIMINNLDNKISNINNETDYEETFTSGSNPGYCVLTYNEKVSAATCTQKYNTYLNKGNVAGYEITYGKGEVDNAGIYPESDCQFEIKYTGITEDYCESLPSDDTNISTEYYTTGNTTELEFKNTKIQPSLSCNFSFDVQEKIDDILVYRPIDLSNPFPGKDGSGRKIGVNWDVSDGELTYEQKYITNRQDVYTKTPLYSVTLTPAQIKEIRNYNKKNSYDDFLLNCKEKGSACYSDFIRKYLNTNKSVCANTNSQNAEAFNSCADYSKR